MPSFFFGGRPRFLLPADACASSANPQLNMYRCVFTNLPHLGLTTGLNPFRQKKLLIPLRQENL